VPSAENERQHKRLSRNAGISNCKHPFQMQRQTLHNEKEAKN